MRRKILSFFIIIFIAVLALVYFQENLSHNYTIKNNTPESPSKNNGQAVQEGKNQRPLNEDKDALYQLIGANTKELVDFLGQPDRIDKSEYDYDWWIYNKRLSSYSQIGVKDGKIVTVYVMGEKINIAPFKIGQPIEDLQDFVSISDKISFEVDQNFYRFELTQEELQTIPLVRFGDVWVQLYFDKFNNQLTSVRFLDGETLVKIRPYELIYRGELLSAKEIDPTMMDKIEKSKALQILDMTNILRERNGLKAVSWDDSTAKVAYSHSKEMFEKEYFSHDSPTNGGLSDRLINGGVMFKVAGENIASQYVDSISAVIGWFNSQGHRKTLLNEDFTHLGVGVYEKYYTQNFIQAW